MSYSEEKKLKMWEVKCKYVLAHWHAIREISRDLFHSVLTTGQSTLNSVSVINGGGAVAVLALAGSTTVKAPDSPINWAMLLWAIGCFGTGVFVAAIATGLTHLAQRSFMTAFEHREDEKARQLQADVDSPSSETIPQNPGAVKAENSGKRLQTWVISLVVSGYLLFALGMAMSGGALYGLAKTPAEPEDKCQNTTTFRSTEQPSIRSDSPQNQNRWLLKPGK